MTLLRFFLCLILKGILADENATVPHNSVQLWRAQGDFNEEVKEEFYERARFTEDIWKRDENTIDFLIDEMEIPYVTKLLDMYNVSHKVLLKDFAGQIDDAIVNSFAFRRNAMSGVFKWTEYPTLAVINRYLVRMATEFPTHCSVVSIGRSKENKHINMLKITNGNKRNPAILIDAGIHGHEWTSVISALYFIESVVRTYPKQPAYFKRMDWYVIPLLNPDGYDFSMNTDRLWRKNRRRFSGDFYGVDLNRNFDYNWGTKSTSLSPMSNNFCGPEPFSEEETKAFKRVVDGRHFNGYISIHSSGTKVLYPLTGKGGNNGVFNTHREFTKEMGLAMTKIARKRYTNGNVQALGLDSGSGMSIDWMHFIKEIKHSYMIETRGSGGMGLLDAKEILPAAKEVRAGIFRFAEILK